VAEDVTEDFPLVLDPHRPMIISAWGRKGSGKSVFNRRIFRSWPYDAIAIDVNGNAEPGPDAERITREQIGSRFPDQAPAIGERHRPRKLHFRADPGSATYADDLDRAVGMALFPQDRPVCVWAGEVGELMPNGRPGPHMRRLLQQNRHHKVTALFDGPRPMFVDPLVLAQSDLVAVYNMPNPADRKRVADSIGYPPKRFDVEHEETQRRNGAEKAAGRDPYWFLLWHAEAHQLYRCAPLPVEDEPEDQADDGAAA